MHFSRKALMQLILPLVLEQFLSVAIGMADTIMVSTAGEAAVSGISLVDSLNILLIQVFSALATGGAVVCSQYIGRQDRKMACNAARQLYYSVFFVASLVALVCLCFRDGLLRLVFGSIEPDVLVAAQIYIVYSAISYPFLGIYNAGAALFRSMGNSKVSLIASLIMNVINIVGNAIFIFGMHMGVAGAALATLISRMFGAVLMTVLLYNNHLQIYLHRLFHMRFDWPIIKSILGIGVPNGLENGMFQIGKVLVSSLIATFGTTAIAANAVASNFSSLQVMPGSAIGLAMITVVGQCMGAGDTKAAKAYAGKLLLLAMSCVGFLSVLVFFFSPYLMRFYSLTGETADTAVFLLRIHSVFSIFIWSASFCLPNALRAAGDVRFTMLVSTFSMWLCRIAASYLLANTFQLGVYGVWYAMVLDWVFRAAFYLWRYFGTKWLRMKVI